MAIEEILLQRGEKTPKANKQEFDKKAKDWSGVDLQGAADAVIADKKRMGGFAESVKAGLKGETAIKAPRVTVEEGTRPKAKDLNVARRFLDTPLHWSKAFPEINKVVEQGVRTEEEMSIYTQRMNKNWDKITRKLKKNEFADLTGLMFLGDAEEITFTDADLAQFDTTDAVRKSYKESRGFIDKLGRYVEQHNRKMSLSNLKRRTEAVGKMAGARGMDRGAFRSLYDARSKLMAQQKRGEGNPETLGPQIEQATEAVTGGPEAPSEQFAKWMDEADAAQARVDETKIRHREGYVPHKFFGQWRVFRKVASEDAEVRRGFNDEAFKNRKSAERAAEAAGGGEVVEIEGGFGYTSQWAHVAGEHGFWNSRNDAIRAASKLSRDDANAELRVAPVQFVFPEDQATQVSDAAYHRFAGNVAKLTELQGQDLQDAVRGVARKRFRRRIAGFSQYRKGVKGYSQDLDRVMRTHIGQTVRYVALDELKFNAINMMEKEGLSENRSTVQDRPVLAAAVQQWFKDVNGQKQVLEGAIDAWLTKALDDAATGPGLRPAPSALRYPAAPSTRSARLWARTSVIAWARGSRRAAPSRRARSQARCWETWRTSSSAPSSTSCPLS